MQEKKKERKEKCFLVDGHFSPPLFHFLHFTSNAPPIIFPTQQKIHLILAGVAECKKSAKQPRWQPVLSSGWLAAKGITVLTEVSKGNKKKERNALLGWVLCIHHFFFHFFFFPGRQGPARRQLLHSSPPCKQEMGLQSVNLLERSCTCRRRPCFANNPYSV